MKNVQLMTSVCTGALLLAKAGLLKGKLATTHWLTKQLKSIRKAIKEIGKWV